VKRPLFRNLFTIFLRPTKPKDFGFRVAIPRGAKGFKQHLRENTHFSEESALFTPRGPSLYARHSRSIM
jgi:hypothetical protein